MAEGAKRAPRKTTKKTTASSTRTSTRATKGAATKNAAAKTAAHSGASTNRAKAKATPKNTTSQAKKTQKTSTKASTSTRTAQATSAAKGKAASVRTAKAAKASSDTAKKQPLASKLGKKGKKGAKHAKKSTSLTACIITGVVAVIVGILLGFYPLGSGFVLGGKTTLSQNDLDKPVGMYLYKGIPSFITARQALDEGSGLSSAQQADGSYSYPSAEEILASVRTAVLNGEVTARGITVTDEEMKDYAQNQLGTSDFSTIAMQYGLDEANVKKFVSQAAGIKKLQEQITGVSADSVAPVAPEEGKDAATYKDYILNLLGDNWNVADNTWANEDNDYYEALKDTAFTPDTATYEQASAVYSVASRQYQTSSSSAAQMWNDFVNNTLKECQVRIGEAIL